MKSEDFENYGLGVAVVLFLFVLIASAVELYRSYFTS